MTLFLKTTVEGRTGSPKCPEFTNTNTSGFGLAAKKKPGGGKGAHPT
jgi:hypothetical protein